MLLKTVMEELRTTHINENLDRFAYQFAIETFWLRFMVEHPEEAMKESLQQLDIMKLGGTVEYLEMINQDKFRIITKYYHEELDQFYNEILARAHTICFGRKGEN